MPSFRQAFFNLLNSRKYTKQFTPDELEKIYKDYRDKVGLSEDLTFGAEAFDNHVNKRIQDHKGFKTPIGPEEGDTLEKLLKDDTPKEKKEVRDELKSILEPQDFFTAAQQQYKDSMEYFHKRMKEFPELTIDNLRGQLEQITTRGRDALLAQQKEELKNLEAKAQGIAQKIGTALNISDPGKIQEIQDNLIKDLKKSHENQLAEFNKTAKDNEGILHKAAGQEQRKMLFSVLLEKTRLQLSDKDKQDMLDEMNRAREENLKRRQMTRPDELTTGYIGSSDDEDTISAINPNDLDFIISLSGSRIYQTTKGTADQPGVWTVSMSPRILSPFYYLSNKENPKVDMLTMAQAVRASGFDSITITINFKDKETQKARAREAYKAALETGFAPGPLPGQEGKEKPVQGIVLKDGAGNDIIARDLFSAEELDHLHQEAAKTRAKLDKVVEVPKPVSSEETTTKFRKDLDDGRKEFRAKESKPEPDLAKEQEHEEKIKRILSS